MVHVDNSQKPAGCCGEHSDSNNKDTEKTYGEKKMAEKTDAKTGRTGRFRQKVLSFMKKNHMTDPGDGVLAAVSGGADSVCLLLFLYEAAAELGIHLAAFHLNHGIRGAEADRDEQFVKDLCGHLGISLTVVHEKVETYAVEHGLSTEEAGRLLRYRHLAEIAKKYGCEKIAVAHHEDDDAETVLLNLFRGTGLSGLSGIRPVRENIIRPLLCVSRQEIEEYLREQDLSWCEDSTNQENGYTRNKIRNELLPWLKENINSRAGEHILAVSEFAAQADAYFEAEAEKILRESRKTEAEKMFKKRLDHCEEQQKHAGYFENETAAIIQEKRNEAEECVARIATASFDPLPAILKTYVIRRMIINAAGRAKDITERHIRAVMELTGPGGGCTVDLPYGLRAVRGYDSLKIVREEKNRVPEAENDLLPTVRYRTFPWKKELEIPKNQYTKWFDYDKINDGLSIRYRKNGDYLTLPGGGKKKVRRYMIDAKIPEQERDRIPLIADGDHVVWIIGYRISDYYKITDETVHVLEAEVLPAGEKE